MRSTVGVFMIRESLRDSIRGPLLFSNPHRPDQSTPLGSVCHAEPFIYELTRAILLSRAQRGPLW